VRTRIGVAKTSRKPGIAETLMRRYAARHRTVRAGRMEAARG
jgi:hypothetical protein